MADKVRDSSSYYSTNTTTGNRWQRGFSKSQMCLHKILRIIASYSPPPPPPPLSDSSNHGSSCSNPEAEKAVDLCSAKRGIEIDLNEAAAAAAAAAVVSAGSCLDCAAAVEDSGVVVEKSSDGECDPISNKKDCSPTADEDSRRFEEDTNLEIKERENCGVIKMGTDRRLSILIEAAELAASVSGDSPPSDFETGTAPAEIEEEEEEESDSGSQSPSLRFGGGSETKRRRKRNKCWVVDLYRETERTPEAVEKGKRGGGRRSSRVVLPKYGDSSAVLGPPTPRRSSPRLTGGGGAVEPLSAAGVGRKRKSR